MKSQQNSLSIAVLISGGLDSAVLLSEMIRSKRAVFPLYIRCGLVWESAEREHLDRFLSELHHASIQPLTVLETPVRDLYGDHWSVTGVGAPDAGTPDEAVFLPGRNVLLLSKALLWCHLHDIPAVALASLQSNPFPDATAQFLDAFQGAVNLAVGGRVEVHLPYAGTSKTEVMRRSKGLPLQWTFSCIKPEAGRHCGRCNKCAERRRAFADANLFDPTDYAVQRESSK